MVPEVSSHLVKLNSFSSFLGCFSRSQLASALATLIDYFILFGLTEVVHLWYVSSVAIGAAVGAVVNFLLNRYWSFQASHVQWHGQACRYTAVSAASLVLNAGGVYAMTEVFGCHYAVSVFVVSALVGLFFNFPLHRSYVFR